MPERVQKLRAIIQELESELQTLDSLDEETRRTVTKAVAELHETLSQQSPDEVVPPRLIDHLHRAEERFQVSHPNIAGIVLRIIDGLGQLGI